MPQPLPTAPDDRPDPNRFLWEDGDVVSSACATCVHKYMDGPTCKAFPAGIPQPIIDMKNDHLQPYPGDHGLQYTPRAGTRLYRPGRTPRS